MNEKVNPDTRSRLLDAAEGCLNERGLAGTSARDIARESGVNLAGIGYHFGSKDALVAEALLRALRRWLEPALDILRRDMNPVERLMLAVQALQQSFEGARGALPVYLEALVEAPRNEALREPVRDLFGELQSFVANQLREQQASGFLPAWIDPTAMATLLIGTINGLAVQAVLDPERFDHRSVAAQGIQLLVSARNS